MSAGSHTVRCLAVRDSERKRGHVSLTQMFSALRPLNTHRFHITVAAPQQSIHLFVLEDG